MENNTITCSCLDELKFSKIEMDRIEERIQYLENKSINTKSIVRLSEICSKKNNPIGIYYEEIERLEEKISQLLLTINKVKDKIDLIRVPLYRLVLSYYYIDHLSINVIAHKLSYSSSHVKRIKHLALIEYGKIINKST